MMGTNGQPPLLGLVALQELREVTEVVEAAALLELQEVMAVVDRQVVADRLVAVGRQGLQG